MNANEIMNKMKNELQAKIDSQTLTLEALDDITYNCAQELKHAVQMEASAILNQETSKKKLPTLRKRKQTKKK